MKRIIEFILCTILIVLSSAAMAQCPLCTPDTACVSTDGYPTICPFEAPVGYTGEYYEHVLTFYIPTVVDDPGTGITATLLEVNFPSVTGMPYGLSFTINDADSTYHPVDGENHGCATICGIPLIPGVYTVNITVNILAEAFGFEITQVQNFPYTIVIEPGAGDTGSFTFDNPAGCGGLDVNFEATIVAPAPAITTYAWDFGNGQTSTESTANIFYDEVGEYQVTLTTSIGNFTLDNVSVSNLSTNGNGDIDDFFSPPADPYFIISDGSGTPIYTSATVDNTTSNTWTGVGLGLQNPPYTIQFFDEDDVSADDELGTTTVVINEGLNYFDIGNGTVGTVSISLDITNVINDTTTVIVFGTPNAEFTVGNASLAYNDPSIVSYIWYVNGAVVDNTTNTITLGPGGQYTCEVTNEFGCTAVSSAYLYCPAVVVQYDALAQEVFVDDIYESYQWYYNGLAIDSANLSYYPNTQNGNYAVEVTTNYGCTTLSGVYIVSVGVSEDNEQRFLVYPNPVYDMLTVKNSSRNSGSDLTIYNMLGLVVYTQQMASSTQQIDMSELAAGVYTVQVNNQRIQVIKK
jgi:Secretion system C-terminal sorting domain/PKD domain